MSDLVSIKIVGVGGHIPLPPDGRMRSVVRGWTGQVAPETADRLTRSGVARRVEDTASGSSGASKPLDKMSVKELREHAKQVGTPIPASATSKADILAVLQAAKPAVREPIDGDLPDDLATLTHGQLLTLADEWFADDEERLDAAGKASEGELLSLLRQYEQENPDA